MGCCPSFRFLKGQKLNTKKESYSASKDNVDVRDKSDVPKDGSSAPDAAPTFRFQELAIATNNFSPELFIGKGGFGAVYRGKLGSGQEVAVKKLDQSGLQGDKEFLVEVLMLSLFHHPNLVKLIGFCAEDTHRLLVYEYMPLGSLEDHLFDLTPDKEPLDWNTRIKIAAGAARGLESLHCANPQVIYRDMKASNILLGEGFHTKLSDFGLAKFGPSGDRTHVSTRVMGTYGYCAPEYASTGKLTLKTDIYSYGIVLLELITGRRAVDEVNGRQKHITTWALPLMKDRKNFPQLADPLLRGQFSASDFTKAIEVASMCLNENANLRPNASELVLAMDYLESRKYKRKEAKEVSAKWPEIVVSPSETSAILATDLDRDSAVAEAKMWGETWREKKRQGSRNVSQDNKSMGNDNEGTDENNVRSWEIIIHQVANHTETDVSYIAANGMEIFQLLKATETKLLLSGEHTTLDNLFLPKNPKVK